MSDVALGKAAIEALLPKGAIWTPAEGKGFDLFLDGLGDCIEDTIDYLAGLAFIRDPFKTTILEDLQKEYAVTLPTLDEELRRKKVAARKYVKRRDGTIEQMQFFLDDAGFDLNVYDNSPAVDPENIGTNLLVNNLKQGDNNYYEIPNDPGYWPNFIFIGGTATRGGSGELLSVADADVDIRRANELRDLIVSLKQMGVWAILNINLVNPEGGTGDEPFGFWGDSEALGWSDVDNPDVGGRYLGVGD